MKTKLMLTCCLLWTLTNLSAQNNIQNEIDQFLQQQYRPQEPGGVVMVSKNGTVIYKRAFGMGDLERNIPTNDSMVYYIGSNTKQFTAVAILQLVEKGKLSLSDPIGKFLVMPDPIGKITIQQFLSQTSGVNDKNEEVIGKLLSGKPVEHIENFTFKPGAQWVYNNKNFYVLSSVLEKISGMTYEDYIIQNIFKPAGMMHSRIDEEASIVPNRASGYKAVRGGFLNSRPLDKMGASGGIQSTVEDMLKWIQALKSGILLKQETLQQAFIPQKLLNGDITNYGFGWYIEELHGSPTRRHGGMTPGYTSETLYFPDEDVYVIILNNTELSPFPITIVSRVIGGIAINKPYLFNSIAIEKSALKKYIGLYENDFGELINITQNDSTLVFQRPNGNPYLLKYVGKDEFFLDTADKFTRVNFNLDQSGTISSLKFSRMDIMPSTWKRSNKPLLKLSPKKIDENILKDYSGKYSLNEKDTLSIKKDGNFLYLLLNNEELLLAPTNNTRFFALKKDHEIVFLKNSKTNEMELQLIQNKKNKKYSKLK